MNKPATMLWGSPSSPRTAHLEVNWGSWPLDPNWQLGPTSQKWALWVAVKTLWLMAQGGKASFSALPALTADSRLLWFWALRLGVVCCMAIVTRTETNLETLTIVQINRIKKQLEKQLWEWGEGLDGMKIQSIERLQPKM